MVEVDTNAIDDTKRVTLVLEATEGMSRFGDRPRLVLRCQSGEVEAYINWSDFMGTDESRVTTRIDTLPAQKRMWTNSTDNKATFYPGNDLAFVRSLLTASRFVAQATPYSESPITAVFSLKGLDVASEPLLGTCRR